MVWVGAGQTALVCFHVLANYLQNQYRIDCDVSFLERPSFDFFLDSLGYPCRSAQSEKKLNVYFLVFSWELGILPRVPRETLLLCT